MTEYIELEATVKLLQSLGSRDYRREKGTIDQAIKMASYSEYTPSANVAPVVHGRWINAYISGIHHYKCSKCREYTEATWHANFNYNFCPNCGARMDGE